MLLIALHHAWVAGLDLLTGQHLRPPLEHLAVEVGALLHRGVALLDDAGQLVQVVLRRIVGEGHGEAAVDLHVVDRAGFDRASWNDVGSWSLAPPPVIVSVKDPGAPTSSGTLA